MSTNNQTQNNEMGFALIDALVGMTVAAILTLAFITSMIQANKVSDLARDRFTANLYVLEVYEVITSMSIEDYTALAANTCTTASPCSISQNGTIWSVNSGTETIDSRFTRSFVLNEVRRDSSTDDVVTSGGVVDPDSLRLDISVDWTHKGENLSQYMSAIVHKIEN